MLLGQPKHLRVPTMVTKRIYLVALSYLLLLASGSSLWGQEVDRFSALLPPGSRFEKDLSQSPSKDASGMRDFGEVFRFTHDGTFDQAIAFFQARGIRIVEIKKGRPALNKKPSEHVKEPGYRIGRGRSGEFSILLENRRFDRGRGAWVEKTTISFSSVPPTTMEKQGVKKDLSVTEEAVKKYLPQDAKAKGPKDKGSLRYQTALSFEETLAILEKAGVKITEQNLPPRVMKSAKTVQPRLAVGTTQDGYFIQVSSHLFSPKAKNWVSQTTITFKISSQKPKSPKVGPGLLPAPASSTNAPPSKPK